jgi:hypothetical protein
MTNKSRSKNQPTPSTTQNPKSGHQEKYQTKNLGQKGEDFQSEPFEGIDEELSSSLNQMKQTATPRTFHSIKHRSPSPNFNQVAVAS